MYRCTHRAFREKYTSDFIAELANGHGARQVRVICDDPAADPSLAAARYVGRQHRLPIICSAEVGAADATLAVQVPRATNVPFDRFTLPSADEEMIGEIAERLKRLLSQAQQTPRVVSSDALPMICFGGRGPSIAARLAEDCGLDSALIPPCAGMLGTIGMLMADIVLNFRRALPPGEMKISALKQTFGRLMDRACEAITREGYDLDDAVCRRIAEMGYAGKADSVDVDCEMLADESRLLAGFHELCPTLTDGGEEAGPIEVRAIRVQAVIETRTADLLGSHIDRGQSAVIGSLLDQHPPETALPKTGFHSKRPQEFSAPDGWVVFPLSELKTGSAIRGPACVDTAFSSTMIPKGWLGELATTGGLILHRG